jgi:hypothetical protein
VDAQFGAEPHWQVLLGNGGGRGARSLLQYGITPTDSSKTDATMRVLVKNYPYEMIAPDFSNKPNILILLKPKKLHTYVLPSVPERRPRLGTRLY